MGSSIADRVVETATTTGTGNITLAGALTGYIRFDDWFSTGNSFPYLIEAVDGSGVATGEWETGVGTYSATNTLVRTHVHYGSNGTSLVSFSAGTKRVHVAATARALAQRGALVRRTSTLSGADFTAGTAITWQSASFDTDTATVYARARVQICLANVTADEPLIARIDSTPVASVADAVFTGSFPTTTPAFQLVTGPRLVNDGDDFSVYLKTSVDASIDVLTTSWFEIEILKLGW
jgi:hypothetical protein